MLKQTLCALALLSLSGVGNVAAEELTVRLAATKIDGLIERTLAGKYNQLFEVIWLNSKLRIDVNILPGKRVPREFRSFNYDCIFPGNLVDPSQELISSTAFNKAQAFVARLQELPPITSKSQLPKGFIGKVDGLKYNGWGELPDVAYLTVTSEAELLRLLEFGRVVAALVYFPDAHLARPDVADRLIFDSSRPIVSLDEALLCHNTPKNRTFIEKFNAQIEEMRANGTLRRLLGAIYHE